MEVSEINPKSLIVSLITSYSTKEGIFDGSPNIHSEI